MMFQRHALGRASIRELKDWIFDCLVYMPDLQRQHVVTTGVKQIAARDRLEIWKMLQRVEVFADYLHQGLMVLKYH